MDRTKCEGGCGKVPEVYGSSWCAWCHDNIPRGAQERIITMRNALLDIAHRRGVPAVTLKHIAVEALVSG